MCSAGRPPELSNSAIAKLVTEYFCFEAVDESSVKQFPSYDDRNFYFRGTPQNVASTEQQPTPSTFEQEQPGQQSKAEFVLKLNNPIFASYDVIRGLNALLNHLHAHGCSRCIRPLPSRGGADVLEIPKSKLLSYDGCVEPDDCHEADKFAESNLSVRVVTFIPGECLDEVDKRYLTPRLLYDVGQCIGHTAAILEVSGIMAEIVLHTMLCVNFETGFTCAVCSVMLWCNECVTFLTILNPCIV